MSNLTLDFTDAGGGRCCWVKWKGEIIEHYNEPEQLDDAMREQLTRQCEHLERLGVEVCSGTVVWTWKWFENCPVDSPWLPLLRLRPGLYEHGMDEATAAKCKEAHCPGEVYPADGSVVFARGDRAVRFHPVEEIIAALCR